jgi:hypothetical protein
MFKAVFNALRRAIDLTLAPILMGMAAWIVEQFTAGVTWMMVSVADMVVTVIAGVLSVVPAPAIDISEGTLGAETLDLLSVMGVWPAVTVIILGYGVHFTVRVITLGIIK